ncbi:metal ABC transporter substrate-binding protein [Agarivorans sp. QJM3NY_29]|uniref:metal ABC transporter substrate-binding protein n=1 Tax=unclassified Agarivorans TaxID=2636026 RepID=UPI003D7E55D8
MIQRYLVTVFIYFSIFIPTLSIADPVKVVTSFSVLQDLVQQVGGEQIQLTNLVGANGDAHVYQPSPADAQAVAEADLLVVNGLGFEGWMDRLVGSSGFHGLKVTASDGIHVIHLEHHQDGDSEHQEHHHGDFDPHAWHSVVNVRTYVENIRHALVTVAPQHEAYFKQNAALYLKQLTRLQTELKAQMSQIPEDQRQVITSHDAFGYLARDYGFHFTAPQGMSTESEASAAEVVAIIKQIRQQHIKAVFVENISDPRLIKQIARETGVKIGGELYSDALSAKDQPAASYISMMKYNVSTLVNALR